MDSDLVGVPTMPNSFSLVEKFSFLTLLSIDSISKFS